MADDMNPARPKITKTYQKLRKAEVGPETCPLAAERPRPSCRCLPGVEGAVARKSRYVRANHH